MTGICGDENYIIANSENDYFEVKRLGEDDEPISNQVGIEKIWEEDESSVCILIQLKSWK